MDTPALQLPALQLIGLRTEFRIGGQWHPAVRDLSLTLNRNETLALVGESGCGKSVTALSVMGLVQPPYGRVAVMYAGEIVEQGPVEAIFANPQHPYTRALFSAIPRLDAAGQALTAIPGRVPPLDAMPAGCRFAARCPQKRAGCEQEQVLAETEPGHAARCHVATGKVLADA